MVDFGPRGRLPCYSYYWGPGSQRTLDLPYEGNTLNPGSETLCRVPAPPLRVDLSLWPSGAAFPGAWLMPWGSCGLRGLDSFGGRPPQIALRMLVPSRGLCRSPRLLEQAAVEIRHEGGNLGLALNPKRWKFGWPPAKRQVGGKKKMLAQLLGTTYPRVTPYHHRLLWYAATLTPFRCVGGAIHAWDRLRARDDDALNPKPKTLNPKP